MIQMSDELTKRERSQMAYEKEMFDAQCAHVQKVKAMELEVAKIESRWSVLFRLPTMVLKLPLYVLAGIALCVAMARKHEPSENFWKMLK